MSDSTPRRSPYDTFRPVVGAWVARAAAVASVVVFGLVALLSPMPVGADPTVSLVNRIAIALLGLLGAAFLWRYARIRAVPSPEGLTVINLFLKRELDWAEILSVGFSGGAPWAVLALTDTEEVPLMAIQRADGERANREASRLAALIEHHHRLRSGGTTD